MFNCFLSKFCLVYMALQPICCGCSSLAPLQPSSARWLLAELAVPGVYLHGAQHKEEGPVSYILQQKFLKPSPRPDSIGFGSDPAHQIFFGYICRSQPRPDFYRCPVLRSPQRGAEGTCKVQSLELVKREGLPRERLEHLSVSSGVCSAS